MKLQRSARAPLTSVEAVAAKVNWKKNLDRRHAGTWAPTLGDVIYKVLRFED